MKKGTKQKTGRKDLKLKRDSPSMESLREKLQQGAGSSGEPLRNPVATSEPAVEISTKGKDKPVVQNLPEAKPKATLLGVGSTDTPLHGASTSNTPARAEASEAGTGSSHQPGNSGSFKQGEPPPAPLKGQGRRAVPLQKWPGSDQYKSSRTLVLRISLPKMTRIPFWKHWGRCYVGLQRENYHT
jgi:hypothetical protein